MEQHEAEALKAWLEQHSRLLDVFPGNVISTRLAAQLADDHLDSREAGNLLRLLQRVVELEVQQAPKPTPGKSLYDSPQPQLNFKGQAFCVVGNCAAGGSTVLENYITTMGGCLTTDLTNGPVIVVVGYFLDKDWQHGNSSLVEKDTLDRAFQARSSGKPVSIISEEHFIDQLGSS